MATSPSVLNRAASPKGGVRACGADTANHQRRGVRACEADWLAPIQEASQRY